MLCALAGTHWNEVGIADAVISLISSGWPLNRSLNSAHAWSLLRKRQLLISVGVMPPSSWLMAAISWPLARGSMKMIISTPPCHWTVAVLTAWRMMRTPPRAVSDTAIVTIAATVM